MGCIGSATAAQATPIGNVSGVFVVGPVFGTGSASALDQGLGKLRAKDDQLSIAADATVVWSGDISQRLRAVAAFDMGSDNQPNAGIGEIYIKARPEFLGSMKLSGRAGLFYPPVSLEHDGADWSLSRTLTPSAANTWIAEEVKTIGIETSLLGSVGQQPVTFTAGVFSGNDTSGTLLAFRGWALHDVRATVGGTFALPDVPPMFVGLQAERTQPVYEVDGRLGGYGKLEWAPSDRLSLSLFGYDNNGNETDVEEGHYAWRTRFAQAAMHWHGPNGAELMVQAMTGETRMGSRMNGQVPADVGFFTTYGLVSRDLFEGTAAARLEYFAVSDRTFKDLDNNAESGWSATLAWMQPLRDRTDLVLEGILVTSERPDRIRFGLDQDQTSVQARIAFRTGF